MTTIAEDFLMLVTRDNGTHGLSMANETVAGALLAELTGRERVHLDQRDRLVLGDATPTGDPLLDEVLRRVAEQQGKKPGNVLGKLGKGMKDAAYEQLARAELVTPQERRALGIAWGTTYAPVDPRYAADLRAQLLDVLARRREADLHTGSLIGLIRATGTLARVFPKDARGGMTMKEMRASAKEISKGRWASEAVQKAIENMNAAMTATFAATTAASSG